MPRIQCSPNLGAFLDMVGRSEGTPQVPGSDDGYNVLVGGTLFGEPPECYLDHPRELVVVRPGLMSTAAGRYQVLERYFDAYKKLLNLPDFGPESQDKIAIQQITESHALSAIEAGEFSVAMSLVAHLWASLPSAGYGQRENSLADLQAIYLAAGGRVRA